MTGGHDAVVQMNLKMDISDVTKASENVKKRLRPIPREFKTIEEAINHQKKSINALNAGYTTLKASVQKYAKAQQDADMASERYERLSKTLGETAAETITAKIAAEALRAALADIPVDENIVNTMSLYAKEIKIAEDALAELYNQQRQQYQVGIDNAEAYAETVREIAGQRQISEKQAEREIAIAEKRSEAERKLLDDILSAYEKRKNENIKAAAEMEKANAKAAQEIIRTTEEEVKLRRQGLSDVLGLQRQIAEEAKKVATATDTGEREASIEIIKLLQEQIELRREIEKVHGTALAENAKREADALRASVKAAADKEKALRAMELAALATSGTLRQIAKIAGGARLAFSGVANTLKSAKTVFKGFGDLATSIFGKSDIFNAFKAHVSGAFRHIKETLKEVIDKFKQTELYQKRLLPAAKALKNVYGGLKGVLGGLRRLFIGLGAAISGIYGLFKRLIGVFRNVYRGLKTIGNIAQRVIAIFRRVGRWIVAPWQALARSVGMTSDSFRRLIPNIRIFNRQSRISARRTEVLSSRLRRIVFAVLVFDHLRRAMRSVVVGMGEMIRANAELSNTLWRIQQNLWTAFAPIWHAIVPYMHRFLQVIEMVINRLAMLVSIFAGISFFDARDMGEELYNIANAADEARRSVMGFDQVNQLAQEDAEPPRPWDIQPPPQHIIDWMEEFAYQLGKLWDLDQLPDFDYFRQLGLDLGAWMAQLIDGVRWDDFTERLDRFATAFGNFVNGMLVESDILPTIARFIYDGINAILPAINTLADTIDAENIGSRFAEGFNILASVLPNITYTVANVLNAIVDAVYGFINNANWAMLGSTMASAFETFVDMVDIPRIGSTIESGLNGILTTLNTFFVDGRKAAYTLGGEMGEAINNIFSQRQFTLAGATVANGVNYIFSILDGFSNRTRWAYIGGGMAAGLNTAVATIDSATIGRSINQTIQGAFDLVRTFIVNTEWYEIGASISTAISEIDPAELTRAFFGTLGSAIGGLAEMLRGAIGTEVGRIQDHFNYYIERAGGNIAQGLWNGIRSGLGNIFNWVRENIFDPFMDGFTSTFEISSPSQVMMRMGRFLIDGLKHGIEFALPLIVKALQALLPIVTQVIRDMLPTLLKVFFELQDALRDAISEALQEHFGLSEGFSDFIALVVVNMPIIAALATVFKGLYFALGAVKIAWGALKVVMGGFKIVALATKGYIAKLAGAKGINMLIGKLGLLKTKLISTKAYMALFGGKKGLGAMATGAKGAIGAKGAAGGAGAKGLKGVLAFLGPAGWIALAAVGTGMAINHFWDDIYEGVGNFASNFTNTLRGWADDSNSVILGWGADKGDEFQRIWDSANERTSSGVGAIYYTMANWLRQSEIPMFRFKGQIYSTFIDSWIDAEKYSEGIIGRIGHTFRLFFTNIGGDMRDNLFEWGRTWRGRLGDMVNVTRERVANMAERFADGWRNMEQSLRDSDNFISRLTGTLIYGVRTNIVRGVTYIRDNWREGWQNMRDRISEARDNMREQAEELRQRVSESMVGQKFAEMRESWREGWQNMRDTISNARESFSQAADTIFTAISDSFVGDRLRQLREIGSNMMNGLRDGISNARERVSEAARNVGNSIISGLERFFRISSPSKLMMEMGRDNIMGGLRDGINNAREFITGASTRIFEGITGIFGGSARETLSNLGKSMMTGLSTGMDMARNAVSTAANGVMNVATNVFGAEAVTAVTDAGRNIVYGLSNGITNAASTAVTAAGNAATAVVGRVSSIFGISSPSTVMLAFGKYICQGLALGIERNEDMVAHAMDDVINILEQTVVVEFDNDVFDKGIRELGSTVDWFDNNVISEMTGSFDDMFYNMTGNALTAWTDTQNVWQVMPSWYDKEVATPVSNAYRSMCDNIVRASEKTYRDVQRTWQPFKQWYDQTVITPLWNRLDSFWCWFNDVSTIARRTTDATWQVLPNWFENRVIYPLFKSFRDMWNAIQTNSTNTAQKMHDTFVDMPEWFRTRVTEPIQAAFDTAFHNIVSAAEQAAWRIQQAMQQAMTAIQQASRAAAGVSGGGGFTGFAGFSTHVAETPSQFALSPAVYNAYQTVHNTLMNPLSTSTVTSVTATGARMKSASSIDSGIAQLTSQIGDLTQIVAALVTGGGMQSNSAGESETTVVLEVDGHTFGKVVVNNLNEAAKRGIPLNIITA